METKFYIIEKIEGEYATLKEKDSAEELFIAMALLPIGADVGSLLKCENFAFEAVE